MEDWDEGKHLADAARYGVQTHVLSQDCDAADTPPPLSSLPDQLHAATLAGSITGTAGLKDGELKVAATTHAQKPAANSGQSSPKLFKRGFLDSKPSKQAGTRSKPTSSTPLIKAKAAEQQQAGKAIPDMFKLEPSDEQRRLGVVKKQLLDALAPTPDTIEAVGSNPVLASGFDDPEVMAAVAEVARDPSAIKKYANNPKVQQFYMAFGNLMGSKLQAAGKQQASQQQGSSSSSSSSTTAARSSTSRAITREFLA